MGFLDPKDSQPKNSADYCRAIESKDLVELEKLSRHDCHFVRSRIAAKTGLPESVYKRLRHDKWNSVRLNVLDNNSPNAASARLSLLLEEERILSLLREHRKPYKRQVPWVITKKGAEFYKHHWSPAVRWRALHHTCCPGSKQSTWKPRLAVFCKQCRRLWHKYSRKIYKA